MTTQEESRILSKLELLLLKTVENGCTEAEALAAYTKAVELSTKYNIDLARAKDVARLEYEDEEVDMLSKGYQVKRKQLLIHVIAIHNFCKVLVHSYEPDVVTLFGASHNRKIVKYLFFSIVQQTKDLAMTEFFNQYHRKMSFTAKHDRRWYDSFGVGLAEKLGERLQKNRDCFVDDPSDRAIVLADDKAVKDAFVKAHPVVGHSRGAQIKNYAGYSAGRNAAAKVVVNRAIDN